MSSASKVFAQKIEDTVFSLPFEITVIGSGKLRIKENGLIEFGDKVFIYKENGSRHPIHEAMITIYRKNNLCGVNVLEEVSDGAYISYTLIIDIKIPKEVSYEKDPDFSFWDFFSIKKCFILVSNRKAYAFNDSTGELLWIQPYRQKAGRKIIVNEDHFIIDDIDGNKYRIYEDGRKIKDTGF
jgi:outer membrane protein assembly factor BamB